MDELDFYARFTECINGKDFASFDSLLCKLEQSNDFEAALQFAKAINPFKDKDIVPFLRRAIETHPNWARIEQEPYGQPLFRQAFRFGDTLCLKCYLEMMGDDLKNYLPGMLSYARNWFEETLESLQPITNIWDYSHLEEDDKEVFWRIKKNKIPEFINELENIDMLIYQRIKLNILKAYVV